MLFERGAAGGGGGQWGVRAERLEPGQPAAAAATSNAFAAGLAFLAHVIMWIVFFRRSRRRILEKTSVARADDALGLGHELHYAEVKCDLDDDYIG